LSLGDGIGVLMIACLPDRLPWWIANQETQLKGVFPENTHADCGSVERRIWGLVIIVVFISILVRTLLELAWSGIWKSDTRLSESADAYLPSDYLKLFWIGSKNPSDGLEMFKHSEGLGLGHFCFESMILNEHLEIFRQAQHPGDWVFFLADSEVYNSKQAQYCKGLRICYLICSSRRSTPRDWQYFLLYSEFQTQAWNIQAGAASRGIEGILFWILIRTKV
jgi:hypothetical protein